MYGASSIGIPMVESEVNPQGEKTIHSGHFMVSCIHEDVEELLGGEALSQLEDINVTGSRGSSVCTPGFQLGDGSIDASLTGLFRQMTLAYRGKLVSPKWKNFKGIQVKLKEKIRLNNIIWREWFMQYIQRKRSVVCQFEAPSFEVPSFEAPSFERTHCSPEAIVLEGKYWKRQLQCLTTEYKKWRIYHKQKTKGQHGKISHCDSISWETYDLKNKDKQANEEFNSHEKFKDELQALLDNNKSINITDLQDNSLLFSSTDHPFKFLNPGEFAQGGFSKIVQPHLLQLQPSLNYQKELAANENLYFHDKDSKEPHGCNKISESLEINEIQRQLMEEEIELLKSNQTSQEQHLKTPEFKQDSNCENYQWLSCVTFDETQQFDNSSQKSFHDMMVANVSSDYMGQDPSEHFNFGDVYARDFWPEASHQVINSKMQNDVSFHDDPIPTSTPGLEVQQFNQSENNISDGNEFNQFHEDDRSMPPSENAAFNNQNNQMLCEDMTDFLEQVLFNENLEAARRRASTGSVATSRNKDKKHVSFAVPNPVRKAKYKQFDAQPNADSATRFGDQNLSRSNHPSLLEQLLIQGKNPHLLQEPSNASLHSDIGYSRSTCNAKKSKKCARNSNLTFENSFTQHNEGDHSGIILYTNSMLDAPQHYQCFTNQSDLTFEGQNIMQQSQSSKQPQIFLLQQSTPFQRVDMNAKMFQQATTYDPMPNFNQRPMNMSFEMTNEVTKQTITINAMPNYRQGISAQNQINYHDASNTLNLLNNQMCHTYTQDGTNMNAFTLDQAPTTARSRHSSNDSSSGYGVSESVRGRKKTYHVSAEHHRRCLIKQGFDTLNELVPELSVLGTGKINKASTLWKGAEYIRFLKHENESTKELIRMYRNEIDQLTHAISELQQRLPASGVCGPYHTTEKISTMSKDYVYQRTKENWKFWIFSMILQSWMDSYNESVVTHSREDMLRSIIMWLETKCTLPALREGVLSALPHLCKVTSILEDPSKMQQEALAAAHFGRHFS